MQAFFICLQGYILALYSKQQRNFKEMPYFLIFILKSAINKIMFTKDKN